MKRKSGLQNQRGRSFRFLKKWQHPLDIPFDAALLRTGDCLVRIHLGTRLDGTQLWSHILPEKYVALKRACLWARAVQDTLRLCERINAKLAAELNEYDDDGDETLGILIPLKPYNPSPARDYDIFLIPRLTKNWHAKTKAGQDRADASFRERCTKRKERMLAGEELLRDSGFNKHSDSFGGVPDRRDRCPRCGGTYWTGQTLRCHDCKYPLIEKRASAVTAFDSHSALDELPLPEFETNKRGRRGCTANELLTALLMSGDLLRANTKDKATRLLAISRILVDGWLPRDVANETGENENTMRTHVDRRFRYVEKLRQGPPLERRVVKQRLDKAVQRNPLIREVLDMLFNGFDA